MGRHPEIAGARPGGHRAFPSQGNGWPTDLTRRPLCPHQSGKKRPGWTRGGRLKFRVADDIEAPVDWVVGGGFTDFAAIEADIRARDAELVRVGDWKEAALGVAWRGSVAVSRASYVRSRHASRPFPARSVFVVESRIGGMGCHYEVSFVPLSATVTRVSVMLELKASTLSARLLLQTLKVARRRVIPAARGCRCAARSGRGRRTGARAPAP